MDLSAKKSEPPHGTRILAKFDGQCAGCQSKTERGVTPLFCFVFPTPIDGRRHIWCCHECFKAMQNVVDQAIATARKEEAARVMEGNTEVKEEKPVENKPRRVVRVRKSR